MIGEELVSNEEALEELTDDAGVLTEGEEAIEEEAVMVAADAVAGSAPLMLML